MRLFLNAILSLYASQLIPAVLGLDFKTVNTTNGLIAGHRAPKAVAVWEYLGIPYAKPPLEELRFAAPKAYESKKFLNATSFVSAQPTQSTAQRFPVH